MMRRTQIGIGIAIVLCIATGIGAWYLYRSHTTTQDSNPHVETAVNAGDVPLALGMVRFVHPRYNFSLDFPDSFNVVRSPEGNASEIDVFAPRDTIDTTTPRFQIFITPYAEATITAARLGKDIPNGDIKEMQEALIGVGNGIRAAIFKSSVPLTGEKTREVWFIHEGFIFEVTAPLVHDTWLAGIMKSFYFKPRQEATNPIE